MDFALTDNEKKTLLKLARDTIELYVTEKKMSELPGATDNLKIETGAFVTIHKNGELRGCIGHMIGSKPLVNLIQEMAIAASSDDPRFPPVSADELSDIDLEISVLSPMKRIQSVEEIEVGKHGILMAKGWSRGVLLPQVATEQGWDRDTFLQHTCLKAGLSPEDWKNPETIIEIFSAEIFSE